MSKHTPGPWAFHSWGSASGTNYGIETADHKHGIAGVTPNGNASTLLSMAQHEANARLIAAAPELLAACKWALTNAIAARKHDSDTPYVAALRAAIAKAEKL